VTVTTAGKSAAAALLSCNWRAGTNIKKNHSRASPHQPRAALSCTVLQQQNSAEASCVKSQQRKSASTQRQMLVQQAGVDTRQRAFTANLLADTM
jgi:hypothetical protein